MSVPHLTVTILALAAAMGGFAGALCLRDPYAGAADCALQIVSLAALFAGGVALGWVL